MNDLDTIVPEHGQSHPTAASSRASSAEPPLLDRKSRASLRDHLAQLFYHSRLIRNCLLAGLILGIIGAAVERPKFTAHALVLVLIGPNSMSAQDAAGMSQTVVSIDGLKVVQSEMQFIQAEQTLRAAAQQVGPAVIYPDLGKPGWFGFGTERPEARQLGEAVQQLHSDLHVDVEPGSNVLQISFSNHNRRVAIQVTQAVLDSYLVQRQAVFAGTNVNFLTQEIDRNKDRLEKLDAQILELRTRYNVLDMAQDIVLADDRLDGIVQRQNQVRERRAAVETEVVVVRGNLAKQPEMVVDFREVSNNTGNDEARNTLVRLEQERTYLVSQFNPEWPAIAEVDKKIATARQEMTTKAGNLYHTERQRRNPAIEVLQNRLASLEVEDQALGQQLAELAEQYQSAADRITSLRQADGQLHGLQLQREVTEAIYRQLAEKQPTVVLQDRLSNDPVGSLRVVQQATAPVTGRSMAVSFIAGGAFLGLLLSAAWAAIATLTREVYIAPDEAERDLALPVLAVFDSTVRKGDMEHHAAIAQLGALLQEVTVDGRALSSLQIIGLSPDDDRAALVRALGIELATGYDCNTLILDLEGDGVGYAAALGQAEVPLAPKQPLPLRVVPTQVPRLWVGLDAANSVLRDWHTSVGRTRAALDELRQQFDIVLCVAPAELSGPAVRRLAVMVDANVPILRAEHTRAPVVSRLHDSIRTAGGNVLGFVFVGRKYYLPGWMLRWV
jgi:uncharacterized protein involved in exopolysaccharide biosynthesis